MDTTLTIALTTLITATLTALVVWLVISRRLQSALAEQRERATRAEAALETERATFATQREQVARAEAALEAERAAIVEQRERATRAETALEVTNTAHTDKIAALQDAEQRLRETFTSLSGEALKASSVQFLQLAEERLLRQQEAARTDLSGLVTPLRETLTRQEQQVKLLEDARQKDYGSLDALIQQMREGQSALQSETSRLVSALSKPQVRGRWGELQLKRLVELAGMQAHCDFDEQVTVSGADGSQRVDMVVRLPNQRCIAIDAKMSLGAFEDALQADESQRPERLKLYASQVRGHIDTMAKRAYHQALAGAYEFTVIFIPGELFYHVALEYDHTLLDYALGKGIILASPTTLIALLKSAVMGWREAQLAADARKIQQIGVELYERLNVVVKHLSALGKNLTQSVTAYNSAVGSVESRLLVSARRMHGMGIGGAELPELAVLGVLPNAFSQPGLLDEMSVQEPLAAD
jgi:DNA recombination protein RmuC